MGKSSAPEPTDPVETSAATTGTNVSTAIANAFLGNVNQVTNDGTLTYDQTGSYSWTDPYTGETYDVPTFTATQTLSDEQQAISDQSNAAELNLATLANNQSAFLNDYMANPFSYSVGEYENWANNLYNSLNSENNANSVDALKAQLANQGIKVGTEAYDRAMAGLTESQQNTQNQFLLDAYSTGLNTALTERNQPINEITALLSGSQVDNPTYANTNSSQITGTDNASIIGNYDSQSLAAWQQNQAATAGLLGGVGGLFSGLGKVGVTLSDARVKEDKEKIGETKDGIGIYRFRYKGDPKLQIGLMAQDVKKKRPEAVTTTPSGLMAVNYDEATK
ncbi:tail fiber domain-containing protein [Celeribacter sp. SCSIO 80788]|uniref:tail fiber domain-containing protein n=1 Tax=Celeribacter sp. SCSIO 80788 TaxID=3117013 RepID=UPI003DA4FD79